MKIFGIDFTSRPSRRKPITCLECRLDGDTLFAGELLKWHSFTELEAALLQPGPWIAGIDFPFGQSRRFIENIGWPNTWEGYVGHVKTLSRDHFRMALNDYKAKRPSGDKEHRRQTDIAAGSISPQKLHGVPVGLMFYEGAPRLLDSGVSIPGLLQGEPDRIVVEAYPGLLARSIIGRRSYKNDTRKKQTGEQLQAREELLNHITSGRLLKDYNLRVHTTLDLADDKTGDELDALFCAVQAAWAWSQREKHFGAPHDLDLLEGWIADPLIKT